MSPAAKLVIVQPYVPKYRLPFFSRLVSRLAAEDIECVIAAGSPEGIQRGRGDEATAPWIVPIRSHSLHFGGKSLTLGGSRRAWKSADAVVIGLLGSSLDTHRAVLESRAYNRPVGVWGHIKSYTQQPHPLDLALERWQMRHASHVFAYTEGGRNYALDQGIETDAVTAVMNTVDTDSLSAAVEALSSTDREAFRERHNLVDGRVVAYVGGFDESKRTEFLASVLEHLWRLAPDVRILVGGNGEQRRLLNSSIERGQSILLGYVGDREKALLGDLAGALLSPGRIGLIAVEALVLRLPLITTDWPFHAPEVEYLVEGSSRLTAPNDPEMYAAYVASFLASTPLRPPRGEYPKMDDMVSNFSDGAMKLLSGRRTRERHRL